MEKQIRCPAGRLTIRRVFVVCLLLAGVFTIYSVHFRLASVLNSRDTESYICKVIVNSSQVDYATVISNLTTPGGVPMILHFVYKDTHILEAYRTGIESCIRLNINWTVMLWTDDSVRSFISREYPQHQSVFYRFPHKLQRADAIRYLILYRFGGVYLDLDMACRQPLLASLSRISCFLDKEREHQTQFLHNRQFSAMNSAMGCRPQHPFFRRLIDAVFKPSYQAFKFPETIFVTTGPGMLTRIYREWSEANLQPPVTLLTESYFSPFVNPRSGLYAVCRSMMKAIRKKESGLTLRELACLSVHNLGYEASDAAFITNLTVAVHQFTHLGYGNQFSWGFPALKQFPGVLTFTNICWTMSDS